MLDMVIGVGVGAAFRRRVDAELFPCRRAGHGVSLKLWRLIRVHLWSLLAT